MLPRRSIPAVLALGLGAAGLGHACDDGQDDPARPSGAAEVVEVEAARSEGAGALQLLATLEGAMPRDIAVSPAGRLFLAFPRVDESVDVTLAELRDGRALPYPSAAWNAWEDGVGFAPVRSLISVRSVAVDGRGRLWVLDGGGGADAVFGPRRAKLLGVDPETDEVFRTIPIPEAVAQRRGELGDLVVGTRLGRAGTAFVAHTARGGKRGLLVVDLASGRSFRRPFDPPSTRAEPGPRPGAEGGPRRTGVGSLALSEDGTRLYSSDSAGGRVFGASAALLADPERADSEVIASVEEHGEVGASSVLAVGEGRLYVGSLEKNAILSGPVGGPYEVLAEDPRLRGPGAIAAAPGGALYVVASLRHGAPGRHEGRGGRYALFRVPAGPDAP